MICRNKPATTPKWFNSLDINSKSNSTWNVKNFWQMGNNHFRVSNLCKISSLSCDLSVSNFLHRFVAVRPVIQPNSVSSYLIKGDLREFLLRSEVFYFLQNQKQKINIKATKKLLKSAQYKKLAPNALWFIC